MKFQSSILTAFVLATFTAHGLPITPSRSHVVANEVVQAREVGDDERTTLVARDDHASSGGSTTSVTLSKQKTQTGAAKTTMASSGVSGDGPNLIHFKRRDVEDSTVDTREPVGEDALESDGVTSLRARSNTWTSPTTRGMLGKLDRRGIGSTIVEGVEHLGGSGAKTFSEPVGRPQGSTTQTNNPFRVKEEELTTRPGRTGTEANQPLTQPKKEQPATPVRTTEPGKEPVKTNDIHEPGKTTDTLPKTPATPVETKPKTPATPVETKPKTPTTPVETEHNLAEPVKTQPTTKEPVKTNGGAGEHPAVDPHTKVPVKTNGGAGEHPAVDPHTKQPVKTNGGSTAHPGVVPHPKTPVKSGDPQAKPAAKHSMAEEMAKWDKPSKQQLTAQQRASYEARIAKSNADAKRWTEKSTFNANKEHEWQHKMHLAQYHQRESQLEAEHYNHLVHYSDGLAKKKVAGTATPASRQHVVPEKTQPGEVKPVAHHTDKTQPGGVKPMAHEPTTKEKTQPGGVKPLTHNPSTTEKTQPGEVKPVAHHPATREPSTTEKTQTGGVAPVVHHPSTTEKTQPGNVKPETREPGTTVNSKPAGTEHTSAAGTGAEHPGANGAINKAPAEKEPNPKPNGA
ncbi:hypothetical protein CBOM_07368 [Ceraceosorus bombacis]|uniref:Uncharacterized protein n=1 Tax=Ceraceosorus bombacis TaxID=401625 RepID=A0A0P1B7S3_9BASI|nr:hypothetical protein CBOM_07368 [Ceraceosorus bombacis]